MNPFLCFQTVIKEGMLTKQNNSFQRSKRKYFKLRGRTLYYAKTAKVRLSGGHLARGDLSRSCRESWAPGPPWGKTFDSRSDILSAFCKPLGCWVLCLVNIDFSNSFSFSLMSYVTSGEIRGGKGHRSNHVTSSHCSFGKIEDHWLKNPLILA